MIVAEAARVHIGLQVRSDVVLTHHPVFLFCALVELGYHFLQPWHWVVRKKSSPSPTGEQSKNHVKIPPARVEQMEPKEKKKKKEGGEEWKEKKARQGEKRMSRDFFKRRGLPDPQQPK